MKVTLKGLKIHKGLSEETTCFEATVYGNGRKAGRVTNRGQGGCNQYDWSDQKLEREIIAWADKQTIKIKYGKLDWMIGEIMDKMESEAWEKRQIKNKILFRLKGDSEGHFRTIAVTKTNREEGRKELRKRHGKQIIETLG